MSTNYVLEIAIFRVKPEFQSTMPELRQGLREALKGFPGLLEYTAFDPISPHESNQFADVAKWVDYECASAAAKAFESGDARFLPYMLAIESVEFMGHFAPEVFRS
ncbi:MAG: hypothetical protein E6Q34_02055 [Burkholderiaceae bacterium]|nr:MAG: hypothetical protein E6Q34_02055 [Burkholderiaceae bacterium]